MRLIQPKQVFGGGGLLVNVVNVAKSGNDSTADGSVSKPFLTVQAAMQYAWTKYVAPVGPQPPFVRPCVVVNAGTYNDGSLILPPNVTVMGDGVLSTRIIGTWGIDARWTNVPGDNNDCRGAWINCSLWGSEDATQPALNINFDTFNAGQGQLWALNVEWVGSVTISEKLTNPTSNDVRLQACIFFGDVTLEGIPCLLSACDGEGSLIFNQLQGGGADNTGVTSGGSWGNITINATNGAPDAPVYNLTFGHAVQPGGVLTLNGQYSLIQAVDDSIPLQTNIALVGGATLAQIVPLNSQIGYDNRFDLSVNAARVDGAQGQSPILVTGTSVNNAGAFNGGGTGNKSILGFKGHSGLPLSGITSIQFDYEMLSLNLGFVPQVNLVVDVGGGLYHIFVIDLSTAVSLNTGTITPLGGNRFRFTHVTATNYVQVVNAFTAAPIVSPPVPVAMSVGPLWNQNSFRWSDIIASFPAWTLADANSGDGGMPKLTITPAMLIDLGDSGNTTTLAYKLSNILFNGVPA